MMSCSFNNAIEVLRRVGRELRPLKDGERGLGWLEVPVEALAEVAPDDEDALDLLRGLTRAATEGAAN